MLAPATVAPGQTATGLLVLHREDVGRGTSLQIDVRLGAEHHLFTVSPDS